MEPLDTAVHSSEGMRLAEWSAHGTFERVEGADHVFGMAHPWTDAGKWPEHEEGVATTARLDEAPRIDLMR